MVCVGVWTGFGVEGVGGVARTSGTGIGISIAGVGVSPKSVDDPEGSTMFVLSFGMSSYLVVVCGAGAGAGGGG